MALMDSLISSRVEPNKDPRSKLRGIQRKHEFQNPPNPFFQRGDLIGHPVASYGEYQVQNFLETVTSFDPLGFMMKRLKTILAECVAIGTTIIMIAQRLTTIGVVAM